MPTEAADHSHKFFPMSLHEDHQQDGGYGLHALARDPVIGLRSQSPSFLDHNVIFNIIAVKTYRVKHITL